MKTDWITSYELWVVTDCPVWTVYRLFGDYYIMTLYIVWWSLSHDDPVCCSPRLRLVSQLVRECVHQEAAVRPSALRVKKTIAARLMQSSASSASSTSSSSADSLKKGSRVHPAPLVPGHPVKMVWRINKYCLKVMKMKYETYFCVIKKIKKENFYWDSDWQVLCDPGLSPHSHLGSEAPPQLHLNVRLTLGRLWITTSASASGSPYWGHQCPRSQHIVNTTLAATSYTAPTMQCRICNPLILLQCHLLSEILNASYWRCHSTIQYLDINK